MAEEYTCTLSERDLQVAAQELGEDPKERLGQVDTFRKWILQQPHIKCDTDTRFLLRFLRGAKFSQLRAREMLQNYLAGKVKNPDWMQDIDMADPKIQKFLKSGYIAILPDTPDGKKVWFLRLNQLDTSNKHYRQADIMRTCLGVFIYQLSQESTQVHGFTYILDFSDTPLSHLTYFGVDDCKRSVKIWQGAFPARLKAFHYYNTGPLFEAFMAIVKPIMSKKLQDRIHVHGSSMEGVYKNFPMSILPDEYLPDDYTGPSAGPIQKLVDKTVAEMTKPEVRNHILKETSDAFSIDITKWDKTEPQESFRQLNVE